MTSVLERPAEVGDTGDTRRRLVVIGNGMAGARAVEEILERGGALQYKITMFGDEPYGNYNRIMLSHVLSGEESDADIFLNAMSWYADNEIDLHAGVRAEKIDRFAKLVFSDDGQITPYDTLIIATGSRSFMPKMDGLYADPSTGSGQAPSTGSGQGSGAGGSGRADVEQTGRGSQPQQTSGDAQEHTRAGGMGRRRVLVHPSGFRQSPYADIRPAGIPVTSTRTADALPASMADGTPSAQPPQAPQPQSPPLLADGGGSDAPRKLWHSSQGSSGR